jgi:hypothetical protein
MDDSLRRAEREAHLAGDTETATRLLSLQMRSGQVTVEALLLPAALGHEPARCLVPSVPLGRIDRLSRRNPAMKLGAGLLSKTGHFGEDAVLRGGVALAEALRPQWVQERAASAVDLSSEALGTCVRAVEEWVLDKASDLPGQVERLRLQGLQDQDRVRETRRRLKAEESYATLTVLALVGTAARFHRGIRDRQEITELARQSVEAYARLAFVRHVRCSKDDAEQRVLAALRAELVPWSLGLEDPLATRRGLASPVHPFAGDEGPGPGCDHCGKLYEHEGWGGARDLFCSTECFLEGGDSLGGAQQRVGADHAQKVEATRRRQAGVREYFREQDG